MIETVLLSFLSAVSIFVGQLLSWLVEQEPRLNTWAVVFHVFAAILAVTALFTFIYTIARAIARRWSAGGRRRKRRR